MKTYGAFLTGLFQAGKVSDAKKLLGVMKAYGIAADSCIYLIFWAV